MDTLEMLTRREQLMEDIDCIIESNFGDAAPVLTALICDAVCKHFPAPAPELDFDPQKPPVDRSWMETPRKIPPLFDN